VSAARLLTARSAWEQQPAHDEDGVGSLRKLSSGFNTLLPQARHPNASSWCTGRSPRKAHCRPLSERNLDCTIPQERRGTDHLRRLAALPASDIMTRRHLHHRLVLCQREAGHEQALVLQDPLRSGGETLSVLCLMPLARSALLLTTVTLSDAGRNMKGRERYPTW
jgi:hypothetical protein